MIGEPHKCDDLKWVTLETLPPNTSPYVRDSLLAAFKGILFKEFNMEYLKKNQGVKYP